MAGTVENKGNGKWRLTVMVEGERYNDTVRARNKTEAKKLLPQFIVDIENGVFKAQSGKIDDLSAIYFEKYVKKRLKKNSIKSKKSTFKNHIKGHFKKDANEIRRIDVQNWVDSIKLSPKSVKNIYSDFMGMIKWLNKMELISNDPCQYIDLPKLEKKEARFLNLDEISTFLKTLPKAPMRERTMLYIAMFGGLRKGEILGLNWEDVNLGTGEYEIVRTRYKADGGGVYEDTPKSDKSLRVGFFPELVTVSLKSLLSEQKQAKLRLANLYKDNPAIFKNNYGESYYPDNFYDWFTAFKNENNLPDIGLHGLRHTHASLLLDQGRNTLEISQKLGHADTNITQTYLHLIKNQNETGKDIASSLQNFIEKI